jgi:hypothetical protein
VRGWPILLLVAAMLAGCSQPPPAKASPPLEFPLYVTAHNDGSAPTWARLILGVTHGAEILREERMLQADGWAAWTATLSEGTDYTAGLDFATTPEGFPPTTSAGATFEFTAESCPAGQVASLAGEGGHGVVRFGGGAGYGCRAP